MHLRPQSLLLAALCLSLAACATHPAVPQASIKPPAPLPVAIGRVSLVNEELGFVLIDTQETPETGTELQTRANDGQETARLRVSVEKKRPYIIADILKGKPLPGQVVTK